MKLDKIEGNRGQTRLRAFYFSCVLTGFVLTGSVLTSLVFVHPALARQEAAYVIDASTNEVLHANNADAQIHPASLTKMMTLYLLFDALSHGDIRLGTEMHVSRRAANQQPSRLGLPSGQTISVRDAIGALIIKSANDVATVVAETLGGTEAQFAIQMTAKGRQLGMASTTFRNASGLHDRQQVSTARDMARLGRALFEHFPQYYGYFSAVEFRYGDRTYTTHNNLVTDYDGADGIKTGYVRASGFNVVTSARKGGRRLIGVVIGGENARTRDRRMHRLLDASFALATARARDGSVRDRAVALAALPGAAGANTITLTSVMVPALRPGAAGNRHVAPTVVNSDPPEILLMAAMVARRPDFVPAIGPPRRPTRGPTSGPTSGPDINPNIEPLADARRQELVAAIFRAERRPDLVSVSPPGHTASTDIPPANRPPPPTATADNRLWGIQVGAFGSASTAARYANDTATDLPVSLLPTARVQTVQVNGQDLFRARLFGLSEEEAQASCGHLLDQGKSCMLVTPDGTNRSAPTALN